MQAIVLAAGKGTRMRSDLPKVLHPLGGRPLVEHPLGVLREAGVSRVVVVVGHGAAAVRQAVEAATSSDPPGWVRFATQAQQNGTGHAVLCALPEIEPAGPVAILSGDVPLLRSSTLEGLVAAQAGASSGLAVATFVPPDPTGYGRILRDPAGAVTGIREERDASDEERTLRECNAGIYCVEAALLHRELPRLGSHNAQGEIYLTDLVEVAAASGRVAGLEIEPLEAAGVNTPQQLRELEAALAARGG